MPFEFKKCPIEGLYEIQPKVFGDSRGYFFEVYSKKDFFEFKDVDDGYWTYFNYLIKKNKYFSYWDCLRLYHNAPSRYHLTPNNCADFARYIWNNIIY